MTPEVQKQFEDLKNQVKDLQDDFSNLFRSNSIPRDIETAFYERLFSADLTHTGSKVGFNGATPVGKAADVGATSASDVGGSFNQTTLNNNFTAITTALNSLRTLLRNAGLMS